MDDNGSTCKISLDGTDCPIQEPQEFSSRWYSHKFRGRRTAHTNGLGGLEEWALSMWFLP